MLAAAGVLMFFDFLIVIFIVEDLNESLTNEVHLLDIGLVSNDDSSWRENSTEEVDNELVGETSFAFFKEVIE